MQLGKYCEYFYASHYVPIALYRGAERIAYYSSLDKPLDLSVRLLPMIAASERNPDIFTLSEQGQYGLIQVAGHEESILVGPVFASPITENTVLAVARSNFIEATDLGLLRGFLAAIPNYSYNQFLNLIAYLYYSLNHEAFDIVGHFHAGSAAYESRIAAVHTENSFAAKERQQMHGTYQFENMLLASGSHVWENRFLDNIWTYSLEDIWSGLRECYADLGANVREKYGVCLTRVGAIGISAMMHGYMAFDEAGKLLTPFRTWRNTITLEASERLSALFKQNIPQRWSIAHLYQSMLNGEGHAGEIGFLTTLAGYIHWKLTGEKVLGVGDASGMFPIDVQTKQFDAGMLAAFDALIEKKGYSWKIADILPRVLPAGESAGLLTQQGAKLLDPNGALQAGIPFCPPEGDAGTGMVATNSVARSTGNVSAGTSIFAMVVLEKPLSKAYPEIDLVTTPAGDPVAMVHCNNGAGDIDGWAGLFREFAQACGFPVEPDQLYDTLLSCALGGDADCGGLFTCNYLSGEHITGFTEGRPLFARAPQNNFSLANFMRAHLYGMFATLRIGMDILLRQELAGISNLTGHGGVFKVKGVAQRMLAAALNTPVTVMETAGEGGSWGIAILAAYMAQKQAGETLAEYLGKRVFAGGENAAVSPLAEEVRGFDRYLEKFKQGLDLERAAVDRI